MSTKFLVSAGGPVRVLMRSSMTGRDSNILDLQEGQEREFEATTQIHVNCLPIPTDNPAKPGDDTSVKITVDDDSATPVDVWTRNHFTGQDGELTTLKAGSSGSFDITNETHIVAMPGISEDGAESRSVAPNSPQGAGTGDGDKGGEGDNGSGKSGLGDKDASGSVKDDTKKTADKAA